MEVDWGWVARHLGDIGVLLLQHLRLTALAVLIGLVIALPLAALAVRRRRLTAPILGVAGVLYTIPALAMFFLLIPFTGLSEASAVITLTIYSLVVLVRNAIAGLAAVQPEVLQAADAMGYRGGRRLLQVELPLALPAIVAGVRIATVSTVGLVAISALIGQGGLGKLMLDGFRRDFATPVVIGCALMVALAIAADLLLVGLQRLATPWSRT